MSDSVFFNPNATPQQLRALSHSFRVSRQKRSLSAVATAALRLGSTASVYLFVPTCRRRFGNLHIRYSTTADMRAVAICRYCGSASTRAVALRIPPLDVPAVLPRCVCGKAALPRKSRSTRYEKCSGLSQADEPRVSAGTAVPDSDRGVFCSGCSYRSLYSSLTPVARSFKKVSRSVSTRESALRHQSQTATFLSYCHERKDLPHVAATAGQFLINPAVYLRYSSEEKRTYRTWASKAGVKSIAASVQPLPEQRSFLSYCHEEKRLTARGFARLAYSNTKLLFSQTPAACTFKTKFSIPKLRQQVGLKRYTERDGASRSAAVATPDNDLFNLLLQKELPSLARGEASARNAPATPAPATNFI